jgi:gamma-glutamylcyclotransferase (GGCT)/AIG2-like uncharacterized protein YtfP
MKYFAYGSNMNYEQMKKRCPDSRFLKRAYIEDYQFIYDGTSTIWHNPVGNIIPNKGKIVWGGLFEINKKDLVTLDKYENYPESYHRKIFEAVDDNGRILKAIVYFRSDQVQGIPTQKYQEIVVQGAHNCKLPKEYIENLIKIPARCYSSQGRKRIGKAV